MGTGPARSLATKLLRVYSGSVADPRLKHYLPPQAQRSIPASHRPSCGWNYCTSRGCFFARHVSQLAAGEVKRVIFVDTHALVRKLETQGFTAQQAEAITTAITDVLNDCLENVGQSFALRSDLQKSDMLADAALEKLKADVESSQEKKISLVQREAEKLRIDIDRLRSEMRYEMDKISAGQRLDLNLERGRMTEELAKQNAETSNFANKLNTEINALKTQLEASKYEVIKYCIGTIASVIALGLGLLRIFK